MRYVLPHLFAHGCSCCCDQANQRRYANRSEALVGPSAAVGRRSSQHIREGREADFTDVVRKQVIDIP